VEKLGFRVMLRLRLWLALMLELVRVSMPVPKPTVTEGTFTRTVYTALFYPLFANETLAAFT